MILPRALMLARDTEPVSSSNVERTKSALPPAGAAAARGPVSMSTSENTTTAGAVLTPAGGGFDAPASGASAAASAARALGNVPVRRTPRVTVSFPSEARCCGFSARTVKPVSEVRRNAEAVIPGTVRICSAPALRTRTWVTPVPRPSSRLMDLPLSVIRVAGPADARGASPGSAASTSGAISQPQAASRRLRFEAFRPGV